MRRLGTLQMDQWVLVIDWRPWPSCPRSRLLNQGWEMVRGKKADISDPGQPLLPAIPRQLRRRAAFIRRFPSCRADRCRVPPPELSFCSSVCGCGVSGSRWAECRHANSINHSITFSPCDVRSPCVAFTQHPLVTRKEEKKLLSSFVFPTP